MATTHTNDLGLKKIGTGLESGTWGTSTSQNLERISDAMGRSVSMDVGGMPVGSTSATYTSPGAPTDVTWILLDSADSNGASSDGGAEGRAMSVEFIDDINPIDAGNDLTIKIRGSTSSTNVSRTFVIYNNLTFANGNTILLDCAGGTEPIYNGRFMIVTTNPTTVGGWTAGVENLLKHPQFDDVLITRTGGIESKLAMPITLPASSATALTITDGTTDILTVNTTSGSEKIVLDSSGARTLVDLSANSTVSSRIFVDANKTDALEFWDTTNSDVLVLDTTTGASQVTVGATGSSVDLRVWGDVIVEDQASEIKILDNNAAALNITEAANSYINIDSLDGEEQVEFVKQIEAPDIVLTGTDGYILGTPTSPVVSGTKADGYGFRNNSGVMEHKSSADTIWNPFDTVIADILSGAGSGQAIANADDVSVSAASQGSFDIGPIRVIFNTISCTGTTGTPQSVVLGTALGTAADMDSILYAVYICQTENSVASNNVRAWITTAAAPGTFSIAAGATTVVTYIAIGDSGA
jgi:hypothetical protein